MPTFIPDLHIGPPLDIHVNSAIIHILMHSVKPYPSLKPHLLFYSDSPAVWHCLPDIRHIKVNYGN